MKTRDLFLRISVPLSIFVLFVLWSGMPARSQEKAEKSLYQRLGGYDAIAAVVDDFIGRLLNDPQLTRFFTGHGTDSKKRIRQLIVE